MARDKAKDDLLFNCSQEYERNLVANHYGQGKDKVRQFLERACKDGTVYRSTHLDVYKRIEAVFGYPVPV